MGTALTSTSQWTAWIGSIAAIVGACLMLPQAVKTWRTRRVDELSLAMLVLYVVNCALWMLYGIGLAAGPVIAANAAGLAVGILQLAMKVRYSRPKPGPWGEL